MRILKSTGRGLKLIARSLLRMTQDLNALVADDSGPGRSHSHGRSGVLPGILNVRQSVSGLQKQGREPDALGLMVFHPGRLRQKKR